MSTPMFDTPKHYPIEVNAAGQGPAEPEETVAIVCWCGDRTCTEFFKVIEMQRDDLTALHLLTQRQADLLTGVANAVHGKPPGLILWSHHDLPELVKQLVEKKENTMSTRNILIGGAAAFLLGSLTAVLVVMAVFGWPS